MDGSDLELVGSDRGRRRPAVLTYVARRLGGWLHDPTVTVDRRRTLTPAGLVEEIEVASRAQEAVALALHVDLVADLAPMAAVRQGQGPTAVARGAHRATGWPGTTTTAASRSRSTRHRPDVRRGPG